MNRSNIDRYVICTRICICLIYYKWATGVNTRENGGMEPFEDIVGIPKEALNPQPFRACVRPWVSRWFLLQNALCAYAPSFILDSWLKTLIETHRNFVAREKNLISFCNIWPSEIYCNSLRHQRFRFVSVLSWDLIKEPKETPRKHHVSWRIANSQGLLGDKSTKNGLLWSRAGTLQGSLTNPPRTTKVPRVSPPILSLWRFSIGLLEVPIKKDGNKKQW